MEKFKIMKKERWRKISEKMACHLEEIDYALTEKLHDKEFLKINNADTINQIAELAASASIALLHFRKKNNERKRD